MPQTCTVCKHGRRDAIDAALVGGGTLRDIARQFALSKDALYRHKDHIPPPTIQAAAAADVAHADNLLDQVKQLQAKTLSILAKAENAGDLKTAVGAIREAARLIELLARLTNELPPAQTTINLLVMPEWVSLRTTILAALDPFPQAHEAVTRAITGR